MFILRKFWHVYVSEVKKHWNSRSYSGKIIRIIPVREGKKFETKK